jgi:hypothetical protein
MKVMCTFMIVLQIIVAGLIVSSVKYVYVGHLKFHSNVTSLLKRVLKFHIFCVYSGYPPDLFYIALLPR